MSDQSSGSRAVPKPPSHLHDVITGGVEGGLGVLALEPLLQKLKGEAVESPFHGGLRPTLQRVGSGALIGAGATGLIGALVSMGQKKKKKEPAEMAILRLSEDLVEFRKIYDIQEDENTGVTSLIKVPGSSKAKAAFKGGLAGAAVGSGVGAAALYAAPFAATAVGRGNQVSKFLKKNRTAAHIGAGVIAKIGADVGAIQAVSDFNERQARSKAIARAIRQARKGDEELSANQKIIEFADDYDSELSNSTLRRSYRYDSYRKRINAREIDRKTANITRAGLIGGIIGAATPLKPSLVHRAAIGAATGVVAESALTLAPGRDPYGDQTEGAKILQKRAPTIAAFAGLGAAGLSRSKAIRDNIRKVAAKFKPNKVA